MEAHMEKDFDLFMSQLKETNATLDFYCDFTKIAINTKAIEIDLQQLNYLIGKDDIDGAVHELWEIRPSVFRVLGILIATRDSDKKQVINSEGEIVYVTDYFKSVDKVIEYIHGTGLANVFINKQIKNLVDYVFGVETGLDTNARKNRSGHLMENTIDRIFTKNGIIHRAEVYSREWKEISTVLGNDEKRFDFVVSTASTTYLIEVNFYSGGGSKLNEVARSYTDIAPKINSVPGYEFVWITDGQGWKSAKNKLQEAFNLIPNVFNLANIDDLILKIKNS